jgi:hypothetical protein
MQPAEERPDTTPLSGESPSGEAPAARPAPVPEPASSDRSPNVLPTLRASDADRNAVAERLRDAFADGRLDEEEFDVRMQRALSARTRQDLEGLLGDLGMVGSPLPEPQAAPAAAHPVDPAARNLPRHGFSIAVMGGTERSGRWQVPEESAAVAIMGGVSLDLRAATFTSQVTTIRAVAIMGGVEIIVPHGVRVSVSGLPLMGGGGRDRSIDDADLPSTAPLVRVQYLALMGGVGVTAKSAKERTSERSHQVTSQVETHMRHHHERMQLRQERWQQRQELRRERWERRHGQDV